MLTCWSRYFPESLREGILECDTLLLFTLGAMYCIIEYCINHLGCGHCKRLAPAYEEVGAAFANSPDVLIAKVDADADRGLGGRFGVRGFPSLKFFLKEAQISEEYSSVYSAT